MGIDAVACEISVNRKIVDFHIFAPDVVYVKLVGQFILVRAQAEKQGIYPYPPISHSGNVKRYIQFLLLIIEATPDHCGLKPGQTGKKNLGKHITVSDIYLKVKGLQPGFFCLNGLAHRVISIYKAGDGIRQ